ncbi:hypothetical protein ACO0RG_002939 [Hanseniaspora osmophila]|uniref:V-type proton ATPase subunit a n=1 Tax=Hanseniaspora osmophila TaxID=56408 RepID=A0A1E5R7Z6_9ASCO|nr:V-type proton ATPase subunit a, vacuolar isoform [Hanseniaspora osmophila]
MTDLIPTKDANHTGAATGTSAAQGGAKYNDKNEKYEAMFRSAEMSLVEMFIPYEIARAVAYKLGDLGLIQFRDLNTKIRAFQRHFVDDIKKLDNIERQYQYFLTLLDQYGIDLHDLHLDPAYDDQFNGSDGTLHFSSVPNAGDIDELANTANVLENKLVEMVDGLKNLKSQKNELEQNRAVLHKGDEFFSSLAAGSSGFDLSGADSNGGSSNFVTGCLPRDKIGVVEQILWRVLRGNLYFHSMEIEQPSYDSKTDSFVAKNFFIIYTHGEVIMNRVYKVIESLDGNIYPVPSVSLERSLNLQKINNQLTDLNILLENTKSLLIQELTLVSTTLNHSYETVVKEKQVYTVMNLWQYDAENSGTTLVAEGWVPTDEIEYLTNVLISGGSGNVSDDGRTFSSFSNDVTPGSSSSSGNTNTNANVNSSTSHNPQSNIIVNVISTNKTPPTFHRTNKFTQAFQDICDCYGTAQYREVNAGLPTIVTFPFMFAIMFGDMGHGFLMFLAALMLVLYEGKIGKMKRDEIFDMAFGGRYILLFMGLFSMYTGFLYNDCFSKSLTFFQSGWHWVTIGGSGDGNGNGALIVVGEQNENIYPFGLDYLWHGTETGLLFSNSYKMKLSILMGFIHMTYSYMFSLVNHLHFKSMIDIIGNFIPGLIFMQSIFGYLSVCIVYKWSIDWIKDKREAPGLLNMLINMFLSPGNIDAELYPNQSSVQIWLLLLALICVPSLLLIKPIHFKIMENKKNKLNHGMSLGNGESRDNEEGELLLGDEQQNVANVDNDDDDEENSHGNETFGDVMIHQVIHTIEFCLNCVSHTASYLRLWALSLAHAQLSEVLWTMTIDIGFKSQSVFMIFILFALWFVLTVAVLVVMEGTSAMLHSLRLHWVESMSKFFVGEGLPYLPFKFEIEDLA